MNKRIPRKPVLKFKSLAVGDFFTYMHDDRRLYQVIESTNGFSPMNAIMLDEQEQATEHGPSCTYNFKPCFMHHECVVEKVDVIKIDASIIPIYYEGKS